MQLLELNKDAVLLDYGKRWMNVLEKDHRHIFGVVVGVAICAVGFSIMLSLMVLLAPSEVLLIIWN